MGQQPKLLPQRMTQASLLACRVEPFQESLRLTGEVVLPEVHRLAADVLQVGRQERVVGRVHPVDQRLDDLQAKLGVEPAAQGRQQGIPRDVGGTS